jgi:methylmalonyl-CoA mutase, N-terminal domain
VFDTDSFDQLKQKLADWDQRYGSLRTEQEKNKSCRTESGIPVKPLYTPLDLAEQGFDYAKDLGFPGDPPYTRGPFPNMYREKPWRFTQYSGRSTAEETNRLYHEQLEAGLTSIEVAFDLPTQLGYDPDHPMAAGEVGKVGVPVKSLRDWEILFRGIDLDKVYVFSVSNAQASVILSMHLALAEKQGADLKRLLGGMHNDILKEYIARGNFIFPAEPSVWLVGDTMLYCSEMAPYYDARLMCSIHIGEAGANRIHEAAFALANSIAYLDEVQQRGVNVYEVVRHGLLCTTYCNHTDFFEEIAKIRAMRKLWGRVLSERYGVNNPAAQQLRFNGSQTGSPLTKQQPLNNVVRTAISVLIGALSGVQSVDPRTFDEGWGIATREAEILSLRTNQIVAHETRITNTVDPLAGSYFVEWLTHEMEERIWGEIMRIDQMGGMVRAIETGYPQRVIAHDAYDRQKAIESGESIKVGVNAFREDESGRKVKTYKAKAEVARQHLQELETLRAERDNHAVQKALDNVMRVAERKPQGKDNNLMPPIMDAVKSLATTGEICTALRSVWGEYQQPRVI